MIIFCRSCGFICNHVELVLLNLDELCIYTVEPHISGSPLTGFLYYLVDFGVFLTHENEIHFNRS